MKPNRTLIFQLGCLLLAMPILYAASSGPVIRLASSDPFPVIKGPTNPAPSNVSHGPLEARDYFQKTETYPVDFRPNFSDYVRDFYRPLVLTAGALHLSNSLSAYLRVWGVFIARTKGDHFFFIVLNE